MFVTSAFAQSTTTAEPNTIEGAVPHDNSAAGEVHTETGVPHDAGHGVFPPFDQSTFASQLLWLAISFGIFYYLMQNVIMPRIAGILETRHGRIAQDLDEAARLKAEADAEIASYESELAAARAKGNGIASSARDVARAKADTDRKAVEASLMSKIADAEVRIGEIKTKALADVGSIAEETAAVVIDRLVGETVSQAEIADAIRAVNAK